MSRTVRRSHFSWWLIVGPIAIVVLAAALMLKPARPIESFTPTDAREKP